MLRLFCQNCNKIVDAVPAENPSDSAIGLCPDCGKGLPAHRYIAPGTIINGFRVESEIGRGGMGVVYLAKQLDLDRDIALKVLSDEMASDSIFVEAFFREARAAAALNHPNIVQAIDAGTAENGLHYFVMELITGENLELYTRQNGPISYDLAFKCATQIADALTFAWESKKLAHRDIKPENIILTKRNDFKLADLGLAKDYHDNTVESEDSLMATPAYASPEVIRGEMDKIGFKSDMYSFGATLYQLFAGRPPFEGNDPMELCQKQLDEQPKPLIGIKPDLPSRLSRLIDRLMEKNPDKRPEQWGDVLRELNSIAREWLQRKKQPKITLQNVQQPAQKQGMDPGSKLRLKIIGVLSALVLILIGTSIYIKNSADQTTKDQEVTPAAVPAMPDTQQTEVTETPEAAEVTETPEAAEVTETVEETAEPEKAAEEIDAFELLKKNLPDDPYRRWCEVKKFVQDRGQNAGQGELDMLNGLEKTYMKPFGDKLLEDMDLLTTKAGLTVQNDLAELKALLDEIDAVLQRGKEYPEWIKEICKGGEFTNFESLQKQLTTRYENTKKQQELLEEATLRKDNEYLQICNSLHELTSEEIIKKVDLWTKRHSRLLSELDSSNAFRLKNLVAAKDLTLLGFLMNRRAAFGDQELFPEIFPGLRFQRFSSTGKVMIMHTKNAYEVRRRSDILTEQEARCLTDLLSNPDALQNLSISEKKMLVNRAFFLKIPKEKFRKKLCKTPADEKILFQDIHAVPEYILP